MGKMTRDEYCREFALMVQEVTCRSGAKYDALCRIAESFLKPYIYSRCLKYPSLRFANAGDDIYHDVLICLIKSCIDKFLYRNGTLNYDPDGFLRWIYTVARNAVVDAARAFASKGFFEREMVNEDGEPIDIPSNDNPFASVEINETLHECFRAVLTFDSSLHIIFTWIVRAILLIRCDVTSDAGEVVENKVNALVVNTFSDLTMSEIYAIICLEAKKIPWLNISEAENSRILGLLEEPYRGERPLGDVKYSEFFMKKGGKATVSDWVNRVNMRIIKAVNAGSI